MLVAFRVTIASQRCALSLALSLSLSLSLSLFLSVWGALHSHPDGHAGEAPFMRNFPAHASMCCFQFLSTALRVEAVQDPCARLHWVVASHRLEPSEAHIPVWDPASGELASNCAGPKSQVGPASASPTSTPICAGQSKRAQEDKQPTEQVQQLLSAYCLKVLPQNTTCSGSPWECPASQPMRAKVGHICLFPSSGCHV